MLATIAGFAPAPVVAQEVDDLQAALHQVMPAAEHFSAKQGQPPVFRGYRGDPATGEETLVGYAFLTSDVPPEEKGYSGPVQVLVGMDLNGVLTGVEVVSYHESLTATRGDFLRPRSFQDQFTGKSVRDEFRARRDIDVITGASITVTAMSTGIRRSARRVAAAYLAGPAVVPARVSLHPGTVTATALESLDWPQVAYSGLVQHIPVMQDGRLALEIALVYLRDRPLADAVMGTGNVTVARSGAAGRARTSHLFMLGVNGSLKFEPAMLSLVRGADTVRVAGADVVDLGRPNPALGGVAAGQFRSVGLLLVDTAFHLAAPFTIVVDLGPAGIHTTEFPGLSPPAAGPPSGTLAATLTPPATGDSPGAAPVAIAAVDTQPREPVAQRVGPVPATPAVAALPDDLLLDDYAEVEEASVLSRTLADTSWTRTLAFVALLVLAAGAFAMKHTRLRWITLAVTILFLGFADGGFLSVSHVTAGLKVGPSIYVRDLALLLLVVFTVVTTLVWGRVFCGFLCPFGALQDVISHLVPKRFKRELPQAVHQRAYLVKYGILALLVWHALSGSDTVVYQYFEPFGTVFYLSRSPLLWAIAGTILVAAAVVPRFYCRYLCPLGASLGVVSLVAPRRIRRVEQCTHCTVCERGCPTGAIRREKVNFKECVRCNLCETKLIERAGVCRHDMEVLRPRLVQIASRAKASADV